ncbi:MAG: threonine-phosphate decarboxylase CobD [Rhodospirillaceae bacterium]
MSAISVSVPVVTDHGGNLCRARLRFPAAPEPWLDLSTGINPWPYPFEPPAAEVWQRLPAEASLESLVSAAARAYGAAGPDRVATAPGSQALIQLLPRLHPPCRVAVVGPTYAEHALCWSVAGHRVEMVDHPDHLFESDAGVGILVNPNNPDGRLWPPALLARLAAHFAARGGWLVVDEAFADALPPTELPVEHSGLIALRSFGKFFGLAGLRLGFALAEPMLAASLRQAIGPWPVSGPAAVIGAAALADSAWINATRSRLVSAAEQLDRLLSGCGLTVLGGTPLFRLAHSDKAAALYQRLGEAGILVRRFEAHPAWLRFGLPDSEAARLRVEAALS